MTRCVSPSRPASRLLRSHAKALCVGEIDRTGRVSKCGDKDVRKHLYEAANVLLTRIRRPSELQAWGLAIAKRSGFKKAKVAVARKLAGVLHRMWRDATEFRWEGAAAKAA